MMTNLTTSLASFALLFAAAGCNKPPSAVAAQTRASTSGISQAAAAGTTATRVARIVFVGKEHACDCTRKTVDDGWAALQSVLGTPAKPPVERLQVDTEADKVAPYRQQKPIMALPAIYFLDAKGVVMELLQGEVTTEQVAGVLQAR